MTTYAIPSGTRFGQYEIQEHLGAGGMASVYKAYQPSMKRHVAIKVMPKEFLHDDTFMARFHREVEVVARLEHVHILPVYDYGETDGTPYIVMRYMPSGTLHDRMQTAQLSLEDIQKIVDQIGDALDYAHEHSVVHRDLKPGNVMLDERGNAYLGDFGIAKVSEATQDLTGDTLIGTPMYMSPEQARGESLDGRADVYALGVMVFEMLTQQPPFDADTLLGLIIEHMTAPIPSAHERRPDLPVELDTVFKQVLAKLRHERHPTAGEFARDLAAVLVGQPASPRVTSPLRAAAAPPTAPPTVIEPAPVTPPPTVLEIAPSTAQPAGPAIAVPTIAPTPRRRAPLGAFALALGLALVLGIVCAVAGMFVFSTGLLDGFLNPPPQPQVYVVGDSPRAIAFDGESVWVANFFDNTVTQLRATGCDEQTPCGEALGTYRVDDLPVALVYDSESIWAASALAGSLTRLDPTTGETLEVYSLANLPTALAFDGQFLWTADGFANTVTKVRAADGETVDSFAVGKMPIALVFDGEHLWVANEEDRTVMRLDVASGKVLETHEVPSAPTALAFDGQHIWVALHDTNAVLRLSREGGPPLGPLAVEEGPRALIADGDTVWVANEVAGSATQLNADTGEILQTFPVGDGPYALATVPCPGCAEGNHLWVVNQTGDTVNRVPIGR